MNKEFVPYPESLALKELGFNELCFSIYYSKDKSFSWHHHKDHTNDEPVLESGEFNISAPTFSQAFRWFREKGVAFSIVNVEDEKSKTHYSFVIKEQYYYDLGTGNDMFATYEEAELACLRKLIEIVKEKQS